MVRGELSLRTSGVSSGSPALELIAPAGAPCYLRRLIVSLAAATASTYGVGYPAAIGVGPTSPVNLKTVEGGTNNLEMKAAVAWTTTAPTAPTYFFRRISFPATIGSTIEFEFDWGYGLYIPAAGSVVLWNLAINGVVDATMIAAE